MQSGCRGRNGCGQPHALVRTGATAEGREVRYGVEYATLDL